MSRKIIALILIYICATVAWMILGSTVLVRTHRQDNKLRGAVSQLWGAKQIQKAPTAYYESSKKVEKKRVESGKSISEIETVITTNSLPLDSSRVVVSLRLEYRRKGLLWYSTYRVGFTGRYAISNRTSEAREIHFNFAFPTMNAVYDDFRLLIGGRPVGKIDVASGSVQQVVKLSPEQSETIEITYRSQGLEEWWYDFGKDVAQVKDFQLTLQTDFDRIDFPQDSIAPTEKIKTQNGWELKWRYDSLLTGVKIGMDLPDRLNPGPWVSQVTFSAPVSLFLFFFLLFVFTTLRGIKIHPMNYFFLAAAFFSFHLLLAYLVDHISIHAAFLISSLISIFLVVSYMRLVVGRRFAFVEIAISQFVYLVLFSYTFFFQGFTGLAITILCVITLFVVMQFTGKTDWEKTFGKKNS